jgi:predicted kinase
MKGFSSWLKLSETQVTPEGYRGIVYIMRGVPGSGKSFDAKSLAGDPNRVFSADDWFEMRPGGYRANWSVKNLFPAHKWNDDRIRQAMQQGITPIAVDNTNLRMRDARPYIEMANQYQYWPEIKESTSPWWAKISELLKNKELNADELDQWAEKLATGFEHGDKTIQNTHGVPSFSIKKMLARYTPYTVDDVNRAGGRST